MFKRVQETLRGYIEGKVQLNEENTKNTLVMPLIQYLGYDIFSLNDLQSEYVSDMRNNGGEKVDYAILQNNLPVIFIEAKPLGVQLDKYIGQLQRYYTADKEVKYGVLTDGQYYWFFADDERTNIMDEKPFYRVDLLNLKDIDLEFLKLFTKDSTKNIDNIEQQRGLLKLRYFIDNSIKNPDKDFIDYISKRTGLKVEVEAIQELLGVSDNKKEDKQKLQKVELKSNKKEKVRNRKRADKPKSFVLLGVNYEFISWRETLYILLNKVIEDTGDLESVKQQVPNTGNFGILKTNEHKYNYKQLESKEYLYLQLSAKDTKRIINKVLISWRKKQTDIEFKY